MAISVPIFFKIFGGTITQTAPPPPAQQTRQFLSAAPQLKLPFVVPGITL